MMKSEKLWGWSAETVIEYFDTHWDVTLQELAELSGWRKADLKALLMGEDNGTRRH